MGRALRETHHHHLKWRLMGIAPKLGDAQPLHPSYTLLARYSAASLTYRAVGVRIVTSSSAAVGCSAMVASKSALVAFILTAMATSCAISAAVSPTIWHPSTRSLVPSTT